MLSKKTLKTLSSEDISNMGPDEKARAQIPENLITYKTGNRKIYIKLNLIKIN